MSNRNTSRTGLFLMELILAILFFSLSGSVCVQLFIQAHTISNDSVVLNHSILQAQNIAETFYGCNGDVDEMMILLNTATNGSRQDEENSTILSFLYGPDFVPIPSYQSFFPGFGYTVTATIQPKGELTTCHILVKEYSTNEDVSPLYELNISLYPDQEVSENAS